MNIIWNSFFLELSFLGFLPSFSSGYIVALNSVLWFFSKTIGILASLLVHTGLYPQSKSYKNEKLTQCCSLQSVINSATVLACFGSLPNSFRELMLIFDQFIVVIYRKFDSIGTTLPYHNWKDLLIQCAKYKLKFQSPHQDIHIYNQKCTKKCLREVLFSSFYKLKR